MIANVEGDEPEEFTLCLKRDRKSRVMMGTENYRLLSRAVRASV
jgi:hypothetical protein